MVAKNIFSAIKSSFHFTLSFQLKRISVPVSRNPYMKFHPNFIQSKTVWRKHSKTSSTGSLLSNKLLTVSSTVSTASSVSAQNFSGSSKPGSVSSVSFCNSVIISSLFSRTSRGDFVKSLQSDIQYGNNRIFSIQFSSTASSASSVCVVLWRGENLNK